MDLRGGISKWLGIGLCVSGLLSLFKLLQRIERSTVESVIAWFGANIIFIWRLLLIVGIMVFLLSAAGSFARGPNTSTGKLITFTGGGLVSFGLLYNLPVLLT